MSSLTERLGEAKMQGQFTGKQAMIAEAIKTEMASGKSLKEAVSAVMKSKRFNHMTVRRVAEKLEMANRHY